MNKQTCKQITTTTIMYMIVLLKRKTLKEIL